MADIRTTLDRLIVIQAAVSITEPSIQAIQKAWKYVAPQSATIPETPCFMNDYTLRREQRAPSLRVSGWTIRSHLYVFDADLEVAMDIATALFEKYRNDLGADTNLSRNISGGGQLRGSDPTIGTIERAGRAYMAVECFLDFEIKESFAWATL